MRRSPTLPFTRVLPSAEAPLAGIQPLGFILGGDREHRRPLSEETAHRRAETAHRRAETARGQAEKALRRWIRTGAYETDPAGAPARPVLVESLLGCRADAPGDRVETGGQQEHESGHDPFPAGRVGARDEGAHAVLDHGDDEATENRVDHAT